MDQPSHPKPAAKQVPSPNRRHRSSGVTAWLVTWVVIDKNPVPTQTVALILSPRWPAERVFEQVEQFYVQKNFPYSKQILFATKRKMMPFQAQYCFPLGIPWRGRIICGYDAEKNEPYLYARIVDKLKVETDPTGVEKVSWLERKDPDFIKENTRRALGLDRKDL